MGSPNEHPLVVLGKRPASVDDGGDLSQCLFRCIFEQAGVGVAEVSPVTQQISRANVAFQSLLGRPLLGQEEIRFGDLGLIVDGLPVGATDQLFARLLSGEARSGTFYASYQPTQGALRSFKVTISALWEPQQTVTSCIVVIDDVSESKHVERQLRELQQQLEQRVQERTAALEAANEALLYQINAGKRMEEALRQSVALDRTIAASIPDAAVLVVDLDSRFRMAEGKLLPRLGVSRSQLEGAVAGQSAQGAAGQIFLSILSRALAGESASCERTIDKRSIYILYTPLRDDETTIVGAVALALDISERKQAEQDRQRLEQQYLQIVELANEGIWAVNEHFCTTFVNEQMSALLGYRREEMIGRAVSEFLFATEWEQYRQRTQQLRAVDDQRFETRMRRKDGTACWLQVSTKVLRSAEGQFAGSFGMFTDISQRRSAEELLRSSEARFRAIIEASTDGILVLSMTSRSIRYVNPRACGMLGYSPENLIDRPFSELMTLWPRHSPQESERQTHMGQVTDPWSNTGELLRKDGSPLRVGMKTVPLDLSGEDCIVVFLTDLTTRSLLEQERLKAQKLDAIGTLAGGIAHDFNNLLQAIYANIAMARCSMDDREEAQRRLESVEQSLHNAIRLTGQLLTFSKGSQLQKRRISLGPLLAEATRFILSGAKAICQVEIAPDLWAVEVDEGQINQVIHNIVLNADQAMPTGGKIYLTAHNLIGPLEGVPLHIPPGRWVHVMVRDTGNGIAEEHMGRLFDPYFSTKATGNGLGLATTYAIIRKHGGFIDVQSQLGVGTAVSLFLPASDSQVEERTKTHAMSHVGALRVLLLDDDDSVRETSEALLHVLGHSVHSVTHGEAVLSAYRDVAGTEAAFDLVLLDLTIRGGMGGMETLHRLCADHPEVRTILTSGYSDDSVSLSDLPRQARLFLPKPYTLDHLREALRLAMESQDGGAQPHQERHAPMPA